MKRKIITTADGSKTIQIEEWNEHYHSVHGAINEANHVYIKHGLLFFFTGGISVTQSKDSLLPKNPKSNTDINILEIGFGTGLNAFLTLIEAENKRININYVGVEKYPLETSELENLNYIELISKDHKVQFEKLHQTAWEKKEQITCNFSLKKENKFFAEITNKNKFDIIYFDAFGSRVQPELWTEAIFKVMYEALKLNGILVTYSVKGTVKRALRASGFAVKRLEGPPGKRHMLRATKS